MFKNEMQKITVLAVISSLIGGGATGAGVSYYMNAQNLSAVESPVKQKTNVVEDESAMISAIEEASPSVLSIIASKDLADIYTNNSPFFFNGIPFQIRQREQSSEESTGEKTKIGGGTGFIVSEDGLVLTNRHVVSDEQAEFTAITNTGETYYAKLVSRDTSNDLAVVQIYTDEERTKKPSGLTPLPLGDSDSLKIGSKVIAIGNALAEFDNTTTSGIISGKGRQITAGGAGTASTKLSNLLQTDAAINPGNSGGPLVNLNGEVIGINTAIAEEANGIGFAIPINDAKLVIDSVKQFGKIVRPYLGVRYSEITPSMAKQLGLPVQYGAYIIDDVKNQIPAVVEDSPAAKAGLKSGDIITAVGEDKISETTSLVQLINKYKVDERINLSVLRDGKQITLSVKLEEFKE